jgi:ABC-type multidrug transport system fused ATPase/permease subunit
MSSLPTPLLAGQADREKRRRDKRNNAHFWRALGYLRPYRAMVIISIVCAFFVGLAMTSGLGTILPIIRLMIYGDSVPAWIDRTIVDERLKIKLNDDPGLEKLVLVKAEKDGSAYAAGFRSGDVMGGAEPAKELLGDLANPANSSVTLRLPSEENVAVQLKPVPFYMVWARQAAGKLPSDPVWAIAVIFGLMAALALAGNVIRFFQEYLSNKAAILAVNDIRNRLYDHVLRIPLAHFGEEGTSDVTSRLVQDSANLTDGFKQVLGQTIQEPIKVVMGLGLAFWACWQLTLFIICFAPIMGLVVRKFGKKMYRASRKQLQESASMLGQLEATLLGVRVVKASGAERFERRRYGQIMDGLVHQQLRMSRIDAFNTPVMEMLLLLAGGSVVLYGADLTLKQHILDPGYFILVMGALATIAESLRRIGKVGNALQVSNAAAARVFEAMDLPVEQDRHLKRGKTKLRPVTNEIRFEDLTFSYPNTSNTALDGVNLTVPKGQSVAIVGRNGSGKTTLLALLPRFYDPQGGRISIDGVDIRDATLRSLRRQISVVTQDSIIFPVTIAENIAYGHPLAAKLNTTTPAVLELRRQIEAAARRAFAHDFIMEKPQGYDTPLGELGGQLSGGQKQRMCIARAVLRHAPILILDEATSQVDAESEHLIQQAIDGIMHEGKQTTFVIAHRFSTITSADVIVVMERGRIVGQGKHQELLAVCPTYQQLYERQLYSVGSGAT